MKIKLDLTFSKFFFILMYISLIIGFFLKENSSGGSEKDFYFTFFIVEEISKDLIKGVNTLINSNIPHFHMHYIILGTFYKYIQNVESLRFIVLQIYILIPIFFYKCLLEISIKKEKALLLSTIIFLSPYFRSSAIWTTTDNTALLFFLISVFFFLKINKLRNDYKYLYTFLSIIFLSFSALTRFYYITFILYFIFELLKKNDFKYMIINGIFSLIIFFPSVAYYFITKKLLHNFMTDNIFNNIYINISIFFFYLIPFIFFSVEKTLHFLNFLKKNFKKMLLIIIILTIFFSNFDYYNNNYGGGILYQIIKTYLPYDTYIFYILCIVGSMTICYVSNKNTKNLILVLIFFFNFNYMVVYQKYFDPLLVITLLTLFSNITSKLVNKYFVKNFSFMFIYFLVFFIISLIKNN